MSVRQVTKALAGVEDLLLGEEEVIQTRGGTEVTVHGVAGSLIPRTTSETPTIEAGLIAIEEDITGINTAIDDIETELAEAKKVSYIGSVSDFNSLIGTQEGRQFNLRGWHLASDKGGGLFYWDSTKLRSEHNGGTIISPTVPDVSASNISDYLNASNTGADPASATAGVWVRVFSKVNVEFFGAVGDNSTDSTASITAADAVAVTSLYLDAGVFVSSFTPTKVIRGEGFLNLNSALQSQNPDWNYVGGDTGRSVIKYKNAVQVYVNDTVIAMAEFRANGKHTRGKAPVWEATSPSTIDTGQNRFAGMTSTPLHHWYGAFAYASEGDAQITTQAVPFLRVASVAGSVLTLGAAGEGDDANAALGSVGAYSWNNSKLVGLKVLVCSETFNGVPNTLSSRVATITAATSSSVTLDVIGGIGVRDYILPAPSEGDFFRYLGSFYMDGAEVRNISDAGDIVRSYGVTNATFTNNYTGAQATAVMIGVGGYISPLASAIIIQSTFSMASTALGEIYENFGGDETHLHTTCVVHKQASGALNHTHPNLLIPFTQSQKYAYSNAGVTGLKGFDSHACYGWVEP